VDLNKDLEVLRRKFLGGVAAAAASYLAGGDAPPPLSAEGLQVIRGDLAARWRHFQAGGTAQIEQATALDADRLVRALREAPESSRLYRPLAAATTEAATLAGAVASDQGDDASAMYWHQTATMAAKSARSADLVCLTLEDQAWVAEFLGDADRALGPLSRMPVNYASPAAVARVELGRARILAKAGNDSKAMTAHDDAAAAAARAGGEVAALPRPAVTEARLAWMKGYMLIDLGIEGGYQTLRPVLRAPDVSERNKGIAHVYLARSSVQKGSIDRACDHASKAYQILTSIGSPGQLMRVTRFLDQDLAGFTKVRAVWELDEQVRTGATSRYVLCRTAGEGTKVHLRSCGYARRGGARPWSAGEHLDPAEVAASPLRHGYELCTRCLA
jgi:hypothetical protein